MALLLETHELKQLLGQPELRVIDTRFQLNDPGAGQAAYLQGHIPGAQYFGLEPDLSAVPGPGATGRHPLPEPADFIARLRQAGIDQHSHVVLYDDGNHAMAGRMWWMLACWLRHPNVQVLQGGFSRWQQAGFPTEQKRPDFSHTQYAVEPDTDVFIEADAVLAFQEQGGILLDARGKLRFSGQEEPIDRIGGHIPDAVCMPFVENMNADNEFLQPDLLRKRFAFCEGRDVVCYCGSGVTACHNIMAMVMAGLPVPRLYAGSWSEWITDESRPVATHV